MAPPITHLRTPGLPDCPSCPDRANTTLPELTALGRNCLCHIRVWDQQGHSLHLAWSAVTERESKTQRMSSGPPLNLITSRWPAGPSTQKHWCWAVSGSLTVPWVHPHAPSQPHEAWLGVWVGLCFLSLWFYRAVFLHSAAYGGTGHPWSCEQLGNFSERDLL